MDSLAYDIERREYAKYLYPDLPPDEAFLKFHHDALVKFPQMLAKPVVAGVMENPSFAIDLASTVFRIPPEVIASVKAMDLFRKGCRALDSNAASNSSIPGRSEHSTLFNGEQPQDAPSAMAGQMGKVAMKIVVREYHGIHVIGDSLVDHINYYGRWMQTVSAMQIAQGQQVIQALNVICDHLRDTNAITVSGAGGPDGFARAVYDLIQKKVDDVDQPERHMHRFFVYHPDTNWYGAFHRLIRETPLPPEFCAKSDNLDNVCLFMQDVRQRLIEESNRGKDVIFQLLIPSWYSITIREPLHFPDSLHPLRVEGEKHKGKELVEMNLPTAPNGMLIGIANVLASKLCSSRVARSTSGVITMPVVGWGVNGACLALGVGLGALTGLGMLVAAPIWVGTALPAMQNSAPVIEETIFNILIIDAILLSHEDHIDNLDDAGRTLLNGRPVLTTPDGAKNLAPRPAVQSLKPWETVNLTLRGIKWEITGVPCVHMPGGEVTGFILRNDKFGHSEEGLPSAIYFTGDTILLLDHFDIKQRFHIVVELMNLGDARFKIAGREEPLQITMGGKEAATLVRHLNADYLVPIHFESWHHFTQHGEDLKRAFEIEGIMDRVCWLKPGETNRII
ncbi:hypothetical protein NCS52_00784300 [Fusarium sp. LHS14.1]|nr:hypothetical protein NCS52_00784300 [Fusarium sp. LHS14.1]